MLSLVRDFRDRGLRQAASSFARMAWIMTGSVLLAGSAAAQVHVTSLQGAATVAGSPLSLHSQVGENLPLEVPLGARCSLLLADRALVQICGAAWQAFPKREAAAASNSTWVS